jgi:hypothetical protein
MPTAVRMTETAILLIAFGVATFIIIVIAGVIFYRHCRKDQSPSHIKGSFNSE